MTCSCRGQDILRDPLQNHGSAFTEEQRDELGLRGLLPARVESLEEQANRAVAFMRTFPLPIQRYFYLDALHNTNETLFFKVVCDHIEEVMPIIYTPTVGEACPEGLPPCLSLPGSAHSTMSCKSHSGQRSDWYFQSETPSSFLLLSVSLPASFKNGYKKTP